MEQLFIARPGDRGRVESLLYGCGMPSEALDMAVPGFHVLCEVWGTLVGVVGVEVHGDKGIICSLAVSQAFRRRGFARKLMAFAEAKAADQGVHTLYLLTTSAAGFFAGQSYDPIPRTAAPQALMAAMETGAMEARHGQYLRKTLMAPVEAGEIAS